MDGIRLQLEDIIGLASRLVSIESVSGNANGQRRVQEEVIGAVGDHDPNIRVKRQHNSDRPWTLLSSGDPELPTLLFVCHVDTVPVPDSLLWSTSPFHGHAEGGQLLGRGAVDMKGGLAAAAAALIYAASLGRSVSVLLTSDEEIGALGAKDAAEALKPLAVKAVIVPEATDNLVHLGHRGALWLEIAANGVEAHGSTPQLGKNAAMSLMDVLLRARNELPLSSVAELGAETWNLGTLASGSAPNIVPAKAVATIDMRTTATGEDLLQWWKAQPELSSVRTSLTLPALLSDAANPWILSLPARCVATGVPYFTDGSVLSSFLPGVPIVVWGPGSSDQMHAVDEALSLESLGKAVELYCSVVSTWA